MLSVLLEFCFCYGRREWPVQLATPIGKISYLHDIELAVQHPAGSSGTKACDGQGLRWTRPAMDKACDGIDYGALQFNFLRRKDTKSIY
jgi:hypothetical protein